MMEPNEDEPGIKLIRRLQLGYEHGWQETFNHLPASWAQVAGSRVAALTGGDDIVFIDGRPWDKFKADDDPEQTGLIIAYTDTLMIKATITGIAKNYRQSGVTVDAISRKKLRSVSIPETSWFDSTPTIEWPANGLVVADYVSTQVILPMGRNPTKSQLAALAAFMPSLLADLAR